jgi:hypothetical protein
MHCSLCGKVTVFGWSNGGGEDDTSQHRCANTISFVWQCSYQNRVTSDCELDDQRFAAVFLLLWVIDRCGWCIFYYLFILFSPLAVCIFDVSTCSWHYVVAEAACDWHLLDINMLVSKMRRQCGIDLLWLCASLMSRLVLDIMLLQRLRVIGIFLILICLYQRWEDNVASISLAQRQ